MGTTINITFVPSSNLPFSTVHTQFFRVAMRTPRATALLQDSVSMTYAELLQRSLVFATKCTAAGVSRGTLVAIDASRTVETIVAILGVLFAGGAYVPVQTCESGTPSLLARHQIRFLVARDQNDSLIAEVCILRVAEDLSNDPVRIFDMPGEECGLEDPAYVLFTSGSTGARKGVIVPHRGILRLVNQQTFLSMDSTERILLHSPLTFDASTLELWAALLHGGTVVLAPERPLSLDDFQNLVPQHRISTLWLTAGLFHLIAQHATQTFSTLRQLIVGGDVIHADLFAMVKQRFPDLRLVNGYGPTENTTFTACYVATAGFCENRVPIGEPIVGTTVYVLDEAGVPVSDGTPGELATGGDGVALGYLDDAALTAKRFRPDHRRPGVDARLYLTGDIVRLREDHQLEFLGRKDSEVKLAGQRVQLDDVEHEILRSDLVGACVTMTIDEGADKILVAFVVWQDQEAEEELRSALRQALPSIAVPRVLRTIKRLPLTDNGKVDRAELRRQFLQEGLPERKQPLSTLRSGRSEWIQAVEFLWCNVLRRQMINPEANFFDLGGDSLGLLAMQAALQKLTPHAPSVVELFSLPTVKSIATFISLAEDAEKTKVPDTSHAQVFNGTFSLAGGRP